MKKVLAVIMGVMLLAGCGGSGGKKKTTPEVEKPLTFVKTYEGGNFYGVESTDDGGYMAVGNKNNKMLVVKFDKNGNKLWEINENDSKYVRISDIKKTQDGGCFLSGYSYGFKDMNTMGESDILVLKIDPKGIIEWQIFVGGEGIERLYSSETTPDDGLIVTAESQSKDIVGLPSTYVAPTLYFKLNKEGEIVWKKLLGGNKTTKIEGIKRIGDNDEYVLTGYNSSSDIAKISATSNGGVFCAKIDGSGNLEKGMIYETDAYNDSFDVKLLTNNEIMLCGSSTKNLKNADNLIMRLNNNLDIIWTKIAGGTERDELYKMTEMGEQIIAVGNTGSTDFDNLSLLGSYNIYLSKYNLDGSIVWQKIIGSSGKDYVTGLSNSNDGGFVIVGQTTGTNFMGQTINGVTTDCSFIVKFDKDGNVY